MIKFVLNWMKSNGRCRSIVKGEELNMDRYFLLWPDNPKDGKLFPFNACIHHFKVMTRQGLHDHPWYWISIVLSGEYTEHYADGTCKLRKAWDVVFRDPMSVHAPELAPGAECWTLMIVGQRIRRWGFLEATWRTFEG